MPDQAPLSPVTVLQLHKSPRSIALAAAWAFYRGTQHDHLTVNWDGSTRDEGVGYMASRMHPSSHTPLAGVPACKRRPDAQIPLARQIVNRFTEMLLGAKLHPQLLTPSDQRTQAYLVAYFQAARIWDVMAEARTVAGACGSAAVLMYVAAGVPYASTLYPFEIFVLEWAPGGAWVPLDVLEQRVVTREEIVDGELKAVKYWVTRRWTTTSTVTYEDIAFDEEREPKKPIKVVSDVPHGAGRCPVIWYQNVRNDRAPEGDGDCDGVHHLLDPLDRMASQVVRAAFANADPTLVLNDDERWMNKHPIVRKGHGATLPMSTTGKASYLEMTGAGIKVGMDVVADLRDHILETAQCVIPDPTMAGTYRTSAAMALVWRSMESRCDRLLITIEGALQGIAEIALSFGRGFGIATLEGLPTRPGMILPPVVVTPDMPEEPGEEVEVLTEIHPQVVGDANFVVVQWVPYFTPTPEELSSMGSTLTGAAGVLVSKQTASVLFCAQVGVDAAVEWRRIQEEGAAKQEQLDAILQQSLLTAGKPEDGEPEDGEPEDGEPEDGDEEPYG